MKINMTGMIYIISFIPGICCCPISGLIGILTMVILRKTTDEKKLLAMLEARKEKKSQKNGGKPGGGGLMAKLEALQKEQERLQQERMNKGKK